MIFSLLYCGGALAAFIGFLVLLSIDGPTVKILELEQGSIGGAL